jgi:hypothetical protein
MRRILIIIGAAVACGPAPARVVPTPRGVRVEGGAKLGWSTKRVITKQPPGTLIAQDGTVCRVTADRLDHTTVPADIACDWQQGNLAPAGP